ncbi:PadR family transcriptional regulator [Actinomadura sp. HBU206391]|uniref:PadR family transcriptional regulator n=1 Tax=Actinomadura sp. HBU206391 TaxID=2731692 RepID=UPI001650378A|nr:PadR family transcriptional regulator [Actinomadura sp. HBU206391]MBC6459415.1 PadR family transcriptional regulator [Actinomadura sp. HBU206391]
MSATRLLVLGGVRSLGRAHGYQIRGELLSWGTDEWANVNPGSIYHALKQLTKDGLLRAHDVEESDAGPPRTDYELTQKGDAEFFRLLTEALSKVDQRQDMLWAGLGFLSELPRAKAIDLLRQRLGELEDWRASVAPHLGAWDHSLQELLGLWVHSAETGAEWTRGLIARLEGGAYVMADEDDQMPARHAAACVHDMASAPVPSTATSGASGASGA